MRLVPHVQRLHEQYKGKGLHIFWVEGQENTAKQIRATLTPKGVTFPVAGSTYSNYFSPSLPHAWLIDVTGKIAWHGNPARDAKKLDELIKQEVAKVKYPGLGRLKVAPQVDGTAKAFSAGDYGKARTSGEALIEDDAVPEAAKLDAEYVLNRIQSVLLRHSDKAEIALAEKRYLDAKREYAWIARVFKGHAEGKEAAEQLEAMAKSQEIRKAMRAETAWRKLTAELEKLDDPGAKKGKLTAFIRRYEGSRPAADAKKLLDGLAGGGK